MGTTNFLSDICKSTKLAVKEAIEEENTVTYDIEGVSFITKYSGQDGRGTIRVVSDTIIDGVPFGQHVEVIPYSIFKDPFEFFSFWGVRKSAAQGLLYKIFGKEKHSVLVHEDPYESSFAYFQTPIAEEVAKVFLYLRKIGEIKV